jgi:N-glycosylase/DNA lyase
LEHDAVPAVNAHGIWASMIFCILSSQVRAEVAQRLAKGIVSHIDFFGEFPTYSDVLERIPCAMRASGTGHRFPNVKSRQIACSWFSFVQVYREISGFLFSDKSSHEKREFLQDNFSGLGIKQASMLLRDIGASADLAIIDSHMIYYLDASYDFTGVGIGAARYKCGEKLLRQEADAFGLTLSEYDHILWNAVRHVRLRGGTHA